MGSDPESDQDIDIAGTEADDDSVNARTHGLGKHSTDEPRDHPAMSVPDAQAADDTPLTEAGAPPTQQQQRTSLEGPETISGRPRDEGDDTIERTGAQKPGRKDPEATQPPGKPEDERNTM